MEAVLQVVSACTFCGKVWDIDKKEWIHVHVHDLPQDQVKNTVCSSCLSDYGDDNA